MIIGETVAVAFGALRANKMRSFLTMLGIVIGVGAVIAMVALGNGAQKQVNDRIAALGTTLLTIQPGQPQGMGGVRVDGQAKMTLTDVDAILTNATLIDEVQPEMERRVSIQLGTANAQVSVLGTTPNYLKVRKYGMEIGRMFTDEEGRARRRVVVLGAAVVSNLGYADPAELVNQKVKLRGIEFEVIGVLRSKGQAPSYGNPDDIALIPINTGRYRIHGTDRLRSISALVVHEDSIPKAMAELNVILRQAHKLRVGRPDDFRIMNYADFLETAAETTKIFTLLLAGIAAVSLLVGGIGIMNIMLVSVTERTREIGVRKALGATKLNILSQFLIEAVTLCLLGGAIGVLMGGGGAWAFTHFFEWNTQVQPDSVALAFGFSALVGIIFGVWPARRAAQLDPITALRYE